MSNRPRQFNAKDVSETYCLRRRLILKTGPLSPKLEYQFKFTQLENREGFITLGAVETSGHIQNIPLRVRC